MHGKWVAIGRAVVYYDRAVQASNAEKLNVCTVVIGFNTGIDRKIIVKVAVYGIGI